VVVDVLGLGFEVTNSPLALAVVSASTKQKAVEMTTSHGFSIFRMIGTRRCVLPYRVRTKKKRPGLLRRLAWCLHEGV
jgi:hypothetical protein